MEKHVFTSQDQVSHISPEMDIQQLSCDNNIILLLDGSMFGTIAWEINLKDTRMSVNSVETYVNSLATDGGNVNWCLHGNGKSLCPTPNTTWKTGELAGSKRLVLTAMMSSFEGCRSTQLFPSRKDNANEGTTLLMEVKLQGEV